MNNNGDMFVTEEMRKALEEAFPSTKLDAMTVTPPFPPDAIEIERDDIAKELAGMNRRARQAFMSERRRGGSEGDAIEAARRTLVRR